MGTTELERRPNCLTLGTLQNVTSSRSFLPNKSSAMCLVYSVNGSVCVSVAGKKHELLPGRFLLSQCRAEYEIVIRDSRSQCYAAEIQRSPSGVDLDRLMQEAGYVSFANQFRESDTFVRFDIEENCMLFTLQEMFNELENRELVNPRILQALLEVLLIKLERSIQFHGRASGFGYVAQAKQYIVENLASEITVQSVADYIGIHRSYLNRIFREQTHSSVKNYINRMRITQATVLLSDSDLSITEIAFCVGFNSRQSFYMMFQKMRGCSPTEFRQGRNASVSNERIKNG